MSKVREMERVWFQEMCRALTREDRVWLTDHYRLAGVPAPPGVWLKPDPPKGPGGASGPGWDAPPNPGRMVRQ